MTQAAANKDFPSFHQSSAASTTPDVARVYAWFSALIALSKEHYSGELGGKLLLYAPLNTDGAAVTLAGNIAGAATLGIDGDQELLKQAIRHGFCDFLVNSLDEALRILKNEIRKKQPVSVALHADLAAIVQEIVERGVQPNVVRLPRTRAMYLPLIERGAVVLEDGDSPTSADGSPLIGVEWTAASSPAVWLPKVDALAASVLPEGDERLRWLKLAPRYLGRSIAGRRYLGMTVEEVERFEGLVGGAVASGAIATAVEITQ